MYGRPLGPTEQQDYERDKDLRVATSSLRPGIHCVVRIEAVTDKQFGLEYGGIIRNTSLGLALEAQRVCNRSVWKMPLVFGRDDMLYSTPLPAFSERVRKLDTQPPSWVNFPATEARPARPIGYVLDEDFAISPI